MGSQTIRVMIVDDHTMVRAGPKILLEESEDWFRSLKHPICSTPAGDGGVEKLPFKCLPAPILWAGKVRAHQPKI